MYLFHHQVFQYTHYLFFPDLCISCQGALIHLSTILLLLYWNTVLSEHAFWKLYPQLVFTCQIVKHFSFFPWNIWQIYFSSIDTSLKWLFWVESILIMKLLWWYLTQILRRGRSWWWWYSNRWLRRIFMFFRFLAFSVLSSSYGSIFKSSWYFLGQIYFLYLLIFFLSSLFIVQCFLFFSRHRLLYSLSETRLLEWIHGLPILKKNLN